MQSVNLGLSTPEEDSFQWTDCMVPGQSEWNWSSEANDQSITSTQVVKKKKVSYSFTSTDNSPLLGIEQDINIQNQLLLNN